MDDNVKLVLAGIGALALAVVANAWQGRKYIPGTYVLKDEYRTRPHWTDEARWER